MVNFAFVTVFWGGNWPTFWIMVPYKDIYMAANGASSSFDTFKTYFKRYIMVVIMYIGFMVTFSVAIGDLWEVVLERKLHREPDYQIGWLLDLLS